MNILMVCSGNICRSPLAAGVLKRKFEENGISGNIESAGIEPHHLGQGPDKVTLEFAKKHGIDISNHKVRLFTKDDFDGFEKIYVMDYTTYRDVMFHARNTSDKKKVDFFLNTLMPGQNKNLPNPLNREGDDLEMTFSIIAKACQRIVEDVKK